ncbi:MAG: two-component regulator propeller domain-containing protein [Marinicellaceae bacterium]
MPSPGTVNALYEDKLGQIWVGSDSGLFRIHNNKIKKVSHGPKSAIEQIVSVSAASNDMWLSTMNGVWHWQSQTNNFKQLSCVEEKSFNQIIKYPNLGLMALAGSGVYLFPENKPCQKITYPGLPPDLRVERIAQFKDKLLLAVRGRGLFQCSKDCANVEFFCAKINKQTC